MDRFRIACSLMDSNAFYAKMKVANMLGGRMMELLRQKIENEGIVLSNQVLKVDAF